MQLGPMPKSLRYRISRAYQGKCFHRKRHLAQSRYVHCPRLLTCMTHIRIRASLSGNIPLMSFRTRSPNCLGSFPLKIICDSVPAPPSGLVCLALRSYCLYCRSTNETSSTVTQPSPGLDGPIKKDIRRILGPKTLPLRKGIAELNAEESAGNPGGTSRRVWYY